MATRKRTTHKYIPGTRVKDIAGLTFGRLEVLEFVGIQGAKALWRCRCTGPKCNDRQVVVPGVKLRNGHTTSCGCARGEAGAITLRTHGQSGTRLHRIWTGMIQRCTNPKHDQYADYGGRGIKVCPEWRQSFEVFARDAAEGYADDLEIDRINVDGNYEPGNVRWVTRKENNRNKRNNVWLECRGVRMILHDWADAIGIERRTLSARLKAGWPVERALTEGVAPEALA
ncbi:hypothetical protein, partial [Streptomyces sp. NPDC058855]|uniref:hypothetical protein n=1 Tax=Streptomyces sp. NPDC058855 TaxID=3346651 RepID=UPI003689AE03